MPRTNTNAFCITCNTPFIKDKPQVVNCSRACSAVWRLGRKVSDETCRKLAAAKTGEKNPNWNGGKPRCGICGQECSRVGVTYCLQCLIQNELLKRLVPQGEKHYRYNPDARENKLYRNTATYKKFRLKVLERDNYTCQFCAATEGLEVDHIKPYALYKELRIDPDNARTLCKDCHKKTATYGGKTRV